MGYTDDAYRKYKADQEPYMPGVAYAGAAAVAGSILVNRVPSASVKILTPLALAAVTGSYFLPAHYEQIKHTWLPLKVSHSGETASTAASLQDLKRSAESSTFDLGHKTIDTVEDIARQTQAGWDDIKRKSEHLAEAYKEAGQDHVNKAVEKSVHEAKSWLDGQRAEADRLLHETASIITAKVGSDHNKFHNDLTQNAKESAFYKETTSHEQPSSSRWLWWSGGSTAEKPTTTTSTKTTITTETTPTTQRPRRVSVDKTVATAAIKQHDVVVNRAALLGMNAEDTARKVHENVVDASMPKERQSRHEKHPIEISRRASQSDYNDGKYIVKMTGAEDEIPERVGGRLSSIKKDLHHGLQNLEKRAHMMYDGVEHLEHKLNRQIQKNLQDEADFWHQQEMKEQARNARGSDRAM
ncbi:hypothetical protein BGX24_008097 [Mortierella sp. AD032]|nr:hypothetical protein BGX24_008097 [Mortierella sp. AD032]